MQLLGIHPGRFPEASIVFRTDEWDELRKLVDQGRALRDSGTASTDLPTQLRLQRTDKIAEVALSAPHQSEDGGHVEVRWGVDRFRAVGSTISHVLLEPGMDEADFKPYDELKAIEWRLM